MIALRGRRQTVDCVMRRLPPPARSQLPAPGDDGNEISQTGDCADSSERLPRVSMHHHQIAGLQRNVAFRAPLAFDILFDVDPHRDAVSIWILTRTYKSHKPHKFNKSYKSDSCSFIMKNPEQHDARCFKQNDCVEKRRLVFDVIKIVLMPLPRVFE